MLLLLDRDKKWKFVPTAKKGQKVTGGDIIGTVQETVVVEHRIMVPHGVSGTIEEIKEGEFTVTDTVAVVKKDNGENVNIQMMQKWPVRVGRPYKEKLPPDTPLITGQRVIDTFSQLLKAVLQQYPGLLAAVKPLYSTSLQNGLMRR